jgi:hypothetical protein
MSGVSSRPWNPGGPEGRLRKSFPACVQAGALTYMSLLPGASISRDSPCQLHVTPTDISGGCSYLPHQLAALAGG